MRQRKGTSGKDVSFFVRQTNFTHLLQNFPKDAILNWVVVRKRQQKEDVWKQ